MSYLKHFIWKRGIQLAINCYKLTEKFPQSELDDALTSQIRHSSVSVVFHIAEGYGKQSKNEYIQFMYVALGSLRELDTQLIMAREFCLADKELFISVIDRVEKMQEIMVTTLNKL